MLSIDTANNTITKQSQLVWSECLRLIKDSVTPMTFNTWFIPIKPLEFSDYTLKVQLPGNLFWEWIEGHYSSLINKTIKKVLGEKGKLDYIIAEERELDLFSSISKEPAKNVDPPIEINLSKTEPEFTTNLNSKYTFDNFIKGESNQLARAAAGAISDNPGGTSFNPFFIYGGVGLGKTHLVHAVGNQILKNFPGKKVIYLSSDHFTVEFVEAIQANKVNEFSNFYRTMDVLIIDDIQFLTGKEKTQDLFFRIFNTLHQSGKQIILSSDKPPKDLKGMDERLISRFHWGLTADIQPPDLETRIAILSKKAEDFGLNIPSEILDYIANQITSNIRELEGCLIKLLANASLNSKPIDLDLAKKSVKEISTSKKINISIDLITKAVCEHFKVDENKIRDKTRKQEIVYARQICMYLSKELTKSSLKTIGLNFGGRDHSTVIHACSSIEEVIASDILAKETIEIIRNKIELLCT
jgi:chromosomal replication initiator protein